MSSQLGDRGHEYDEGDIILFHTGPDWELEALHDSDGCAYEQDGTAYSVGIVVSLTYVGGLDWEYSYDVLCCDGVIRRLNMHEIVGVTN